MQSDKELTWQELSRREILKTAVLTVNETESKAPDGSSGNYIVMDARDWVVVVPVIGNDFLMVKQWRHGNSQLSIEFPGGVIEKNEKPEDGAKRELKEETGFTAGRLVHLASMSPNPALFSNTVHFFAALDLGNEESQKLDSDEYLNAMKISQKEVCEKMGSGEYCHALMASALGFYKRYALKA
jgi:ADP-ribose pyrophosphatase